MVEHAAKTQLPHVQQQIDSAAHAHVPVVVDLDTILSSCSTKQVVVVVVMVCGGKGKRGEEMECG